jgi:hypothetical protein
MMARGISMKLGDIAVTLDARYLSGDEIPDIDICSACGADLMSDVMAFVKERVVLMTGLINPQVIRTAGLMDIRAIVFVRGKAPTEEMIAMAEDQGIALMSTRNSMFIACGKLYEAGLRGSGIREIE